MEDVGGLVERFGLPLVALMGLAIGMFRGWIRSGPQVDREMADRQAEVEYRERLRIEERTRSDRLETALALTVTAVRDMTEVLKDVEREIGRGK